MVGIARKNENSAAALRSTRIISEPMIVAPERDTPGIIARHWNKPDLQIERERKILDRVVLRNLDHALDEDDRDAADDQR